MGGKENRIGYQEGRFLVLALMCLFRQLCNIVSSTLKWTDRLYQWFESIYMYKHIYIHIYKHIYAYKHISIYKHIYAYAHIYKHIYNTHTHTHTHAHVAYLFSNGLFFLSSFLSQTLQVLSRQKQSPASRAEMGNPQCPGSFPLPAVPLECFAESSPNIDRIARFLKFIQVLNFLDFLIL